MSIAERVLVTVAAALAAAAVALPALAPPASAHAGEEALLVEPPSTWPGGTVMVRGDLPVSSDVHLLLVDRAGRMTQVGRVDDPPSGHFDVPVTVPAATRLGTWSIVAVAGGDPVGRAALTVVTAPSAAGERGDQAEPILVPRAATPAATRPADGQPVGGSASRSAAAMPVAQAPPTPTPATDSPAAWVALALAVTSIGALSVRWARRGTSRRSGRRLRGRA
jgi:hypothetical protein